MSARDYVLGALFYIPTLGAALGAGYLVVRRRLAYLPGRVRSLAFMVCATAAVVFAHVLPAALGILSRPTALLTALALLAGCWRLRAVGEDPPSDQESAIPRSRPVSIAIAVVAVAVVAVYELARLRLLATQPITEIDMLSFHLPGVARFIQTGSLWRVDQFAPGFATAQYPNDGDFLLLSAVLPWRDLAFVRFVPLPFYAFTGVGVYALALELRATRAAAATMAAALLTVPAVSWLALDGLPDTVSLATLAAGLVFLIRHARSARRAELLLAGLALGLSFGTKWYGTTSVFIVVVVWVLARLLARQRLRIVARDTAQVVGLVLLGGGIWLVRNVIESGNPVYPKAVTAFGVQLFAGSRGDFVDLYGYTIGNYLLKPHILRTYIYPGFKAEVGLAGAVFLIGAGICAVAAVRRLRDPRRRDGVPAVLLALVVAMLGICAEFCVTPGSAYGPKNLPIWGYVNIRWLMPAAVVAAALAARAVRSLGGFGALLELAGLAGALDGIRLGPSVPGGTVAEVALVLAALGGLGLIVRRYAAGRGIRRLRSPRVALACLVVPLAGGLVLARADETRYDGHTYASYDPTFAWIEAHAPSGHRVAVSGAWDTNGLVPVLPSFGPRLGNVVAYVGDLVRHSLHPPSHGGAFEAQLRRGRYDLLIIGLQNPSRIEQWARADRYQLVARSPRLALYAAG